MSGSSPTALGVLPEAAAVVDRPEALAQVLLGDALQHDPAAEQHLPVARSFLLEERDQLQRQVEGVLGCEAADLERGDHAHRAVVATAVAVQGVAVRPDPEDPLTRRPVAGSSVPTGSSETSNPIASSSRVK